MESGFCSIFLKRVAGVIALLMLVSSAALAQESEQPPQVIEPEVERRELDVAAIDTEDFEVTGFVGVMSIEDFESGLVYGARLAYHVNEAFFVEGSYGRADAGTSTAERLFGVQLLSDRTLQYYDFSLGWNVLPVKCLSVPVEPGTARSTSSRAAAARTLMTTVSSQRTPDSDSRYYRPILLPCVWSFAITCSAPMCPAPTSSPTICKPRSA